MTTIGDPLRLQQVTGKLLANARLHTPAGTRVTVRLRQDEAAVRLVVEDDGPGISADIRDTVFERFARADHSRPGPPTRSGATWCVGTRTRERLVQAHQGKTATGDDARRGARRKCWRRMNLAHSPCLAVSGVINRWRHFFTGSDGGPSGGAGS